MQVRIDSTIQLLLAGSPAVEPNNSILPNLQCTGHEHCILDDEAADDRGSCEVVVEREIAKRTVVGEEERAAMGDGPMVRYERMSDAEHPRANANVVLEKVDAGYFPTADELNHDTSDVVEQGTRE